jgi:hypothetical protein
MAEDSDFLRRPATGALLEGVRRLLVVALVWAVVACDSGVEAPGPPAQIEVAQGDGQSWLPAEALPLAVVIAVKDDRGNPTPDIAVSWEVTRGGGALEDASALTGASGQASAAWHLGPSVGENRLRVSVVGAEAEVVANAKHPLVELVSGPAHVCGLDAAGAIHCWGNNDWGQLGDGTDAVRLAPVAVASADTFVALATGSAHTCALTAAGAARLTAGEGTFMVNSVMGPRARASRQSR